MTQTITNVGGLREKLRVFAIDRRFLAWSTFTAGLALYLLVGVGLVFLRVHTHVAPPSSTAHVMSDSDFVGHSILEDDAYAYILKAVQMVTCFTQNCAALEDLRHQVGMPSSDPEMAWIRYREYMRAYLVYHPLHSVLVASVRATGVSWEDAYDVIRLTGAAFICVAAAYWLLSLWGPGTAGIALLLLSSTFFPSQGVHHIVPSNLALGIGMLVWGRLSARCGAAEWSLSLGTLAMVAMHPAGRLYALISVLLFIALSAGHIWTRKKFVALLFSSFVVLLSFLLAYLVSRPELRVLPDPAPVGWPSAWYAAFLYGLRGNLAAIDKILRDWSALYGSIISMVALTAVGFLSLAHKERSRVAWSGIIIGCTLITTAFHILPRYPAELFQRVWVPLAVLVTGAAANVAWVLVGGSLDHILRKRFDIVSRFKRLEAGFPALTASSNWLFVVLIIMGLLVTIRVERGIREGVMVAGTELAFMQQTPWAFDREQPRIHQQQAQPSDITLYLDEVPMHFFFAHGALNQRAIYLPASVNPARARRIGVDDPDSPRIHEPMNSGDFTNTEWLQSPDLRYVVGWNPITYTRSREAMVPMSAVDRVEYESVVSVQLRDLQMLLINTGREAELHLTYGPQSGPVTIRAPIPARWSGWLTLPSTVAEGELRAFSFKVEHPNGEVYLKGMRFGDTNLNWPWAQRGTLVFRAFGNNEYHVVPFDPDRLVPVEGSNMSVRILHDNGSTVLGEFVRSVAN